MPKITIITPSFNQGKFIEKTILSVISQQYPNLEYIIIDGGSTDETVDIIKKYEGSITYWISEQDRGQSHAINKGMAIATGEIVNWLNSDDYLEQDSLLKIISEFKAKPELEVLCGFSCIHYPDKTFLKRTSQIEKNWAYFIAAGHIMQPSTFWKRAIFDELTPLEESLHFMMDHFIWLKYLFKRGYQQIAYCSDIYAHVMMHNDAKSVSQISLFKEDRKRIYGSLFRDLKATSLIYGNISPSEKLTFSLNTEIVSAHIKEIDFYLLYEILFERNSQGQRLKINLKILRLLIVNFPFKFAYNLFKIIIR